jgi:hypothetical protein
MEHGVIVATMVSITWIVLQNLVMPVRPAQNRVGAMFLGYFFSLPFVFLGYRWIPPLGVWIADAATVESPTMGLFHAYFFHLLLLFFYVECFYHVERSVTFRLLVELLKSGETGLPLQALQSRYPVDEMIEQRLQILCDKGLLDTRGNAWILCPKGLVLARITVAMSWVFQSKGQHERG